MIENWPVDADDNKDRRGENEAASSEHHENFTSRVTCIPLDSHPPESLGRKNDITDDGVRQGEVEHQVVDVGPGSALRSGQTGSFFSSISYSKSQIMVIW